MKPDGRSDLTTDELGLAGTSVDTWRIVPALCCSFMCMLAACRVGYLQHSTMLPRIRTGIAVRNRNVHALRSLVCTADAETLVSRRHHGGIYLSIGCKSHHQLRHARRQLLIHVCVPRVPSLTTGGDQLPHQVLHCNCWYAWCDKPN